MVGCFFFSDWTVNEIGNLDFHPTDELTSVNVMRLFFFFF